ncbi:hypothetical protein [Streptomyces palmae]|uniref:DUF2690 domain-containing protein n=1 Tax=Streptomyces palmae TaxID=1701085 RepID=A0A4Z0HC73_9ACTN|nr:hypothetical protein [Streptomyces palmae]TGB10461.1 hypothetical protein E4099_12780 [Streptomyces palmae]
MRSWKMIAVVPGLLVGLGVAGVGAAQADDGGPVSCSRDAQGNVTCVRSNESTYASEDGTVHVTQSKSCTTVYRNRLIGPQPDSRLRQGPSVSCNSSVRMGGS